MSEFSSQILFGGSSAIVSAIDAPHVGKLLDAKSAVRIHMTALIVPLPKSTSAVAALTPGLVLPVPSME